MSDDWRQRLRRQIEPALALPDPRPQISAYHDMPVAIFRYPPQDELAVRKELALLTTRLEQAGKQVTTISLAECMWSALDAEGLGAEQLAEAERSAGLEATIDTVHGVLSEYRPLDDMVVARFPSAGQPDRDVVFIVRAAALFPVYRISSLLEQLRGRVQIPAVLFYPGEMAGAAGLRFMGALDPEHNYRARIF